MIYRTHDFHSPAFSLRVWTAEALKRCAIISCVSYDTNRIVLGVIKPSEFKRRISQSSKSFPKLPTMAQDTMRAVIFKGVKEVAIEDRPIPTIQDPKDVIIKVRYTALCGR